MEQTLKQQVNISAPNLLNICIDQVCDGEMKGRFYHCYAHEPETFSNYSKVCLSHRHRHAHVRL